MSNTASYSSGISFLPTAPAFDAPVRGFQSEYRHPVCGVWYGKTRMCGYPMVKNFWRYVYSFWHDPRTWQTDTAWRHIPRLCIASRGKKTAFDVSYCWTIEANYWETRHRAASLRQQSRATCLIITFVHDLLILSCGFYWHSFDISRICGCLLCHCLFSLHCTGLCQV